MSSIILYGRPGSGKTTMASSMCKLGYKVHFIDMDCKIKTMKNLEPLIEDDRVTFNECPHKLDKGSLKSRVVQGVDYWPKAMPQGYLWMVEQIDKLELEPLDDAENTVVVIDTMTNVNRHQKRLIQHFRKSSDLGFKGWGAILKNYEELFTTFNNLQPSPYPHTIITIHAKDDRDEIIEATESRPLIDGQFKDCVGDTVEEMYFLEVNAPGKMAKAQFWAITKPVGRITQARSSRDVPTKIEQDFSVIFEGEEV